MSGWFFGVDRSYLTKEWVFQAFEVQAFDYLLKPIEEESFTKTMYRLLDCMRNA